MALKLDWKDGKRVSIADSPCGRWSFTTSVYERSDGSVWYEVEWESEEDVRTIENTDGTYAHDTLAEAKAAAEAWLDERDQPEWHGPADGKTACAEWRGWSMLVYRSASDRCVTWASEFRPHGRTTSTETVVDTLDAAKDALTARIRSLP